MVKLVLARLSVAVKDTWVEFLREGVIDGQVQGTVNKNVSSPIITKIVDMIRKYHNHKLQTNPWHREKEPHNNHEILRRQAKQNN